MKYEDIINLPHPRPRGRSPMPQENRAAQFAPFSALSGYGDEIDETARLTDCAPVLSEDAAERLNLMLCRLRDAGASSPQITLTYFRVDPKKAGGAVISITGRMQKYDEYTGKITFDSGEIVDAALVLDVRR